MSPPTAQRLKVIADDHGDVSLSGLDLEPGEEVEVVVFRHRTGDAPAFPLRGTPIDYIDPTEPVAESDWAV